MTLDTNKDLCLLILKKMLLSKHGDLREEILIRQGRAKDHVSRRGHEALIALTIQLHEDDYLFTYYRGCHLILGKGATREEIANDFFATSASSSYGRCPAAHFGSTDLKIFPSIAPVAAQCLPAVGVAWYFKLKNINNVVVCSIGDGALRQGEFYEAITFAVQERLPILFLIEDNDYAISTKTESMNPLNMSIFPDSMVHKIDGRDVFTVYEKSRQIISSIRMNGGPYILWCKLDRLQPHTAIDDHRIYRGSSELNTLTDPVELFYTQLLKRKIISEQEYVVLDDKIKLEMKQVYTSIEKLPRPEKSHIYSGLEFTERSGTYFSKSNREVECNTIIEAINSALKDGLTEYNNMYLFGQDIADPKGGVFGLTKGLSTDFPGRVVNAPLAEATMLGTAVGMASCGMKPVIEMQFIDFITPAFNQLANQLTTLRWRTHNKWQCPVIIYAPYGAYLPSGGVWHSQSNEGWWTHIPGLKVAIPSNPVDVYDVFSDAFESIDPYLILIPKHLFTCQFSQQFITKDKYIGHRIIKEGQDISIITWGNCVELCVKAAESLAQQNHISVEVIDLFNLVPCNWQILKKSVIKTGRLLVVHEDNKTSGFGATVITELLNDNEVFESLYTKPMLIARNDVHVPFDAACEYSVLPSTELIIERICSLFN